MGWRWSIASFKDGDVVNPREIVSDCRSVSSEMNGYIDRDNLNGDFILRDKALAKDAANQFWYTFSVSEPTITGHSGLASRFTLVEDLELTAQAKPGVFEIESSLSYQRTSDPDDEVPRFQMAVFFNDRLIACTFPEGNTYNYDLKKYGSNMNKSAKKVNEGYQTKNTLHCNCMVPAPGGSHRVWVGYRLVRKKSTEGRDSSFKFKWYDRNLYVRNLLR